MGFFFTTTLFKPAKKPNVAKAVLNAALKIGAYAMPCKDLKKDNLLKLSEKNGVISAHYSYAAGNHYFLNALASEFYAAECVENGACLYLEARIQEGEHWDYTLRYPGAHLDTFSTQPFYNCENELVARTRMGREETLALAWNVPLESIDKYIMQWDVVDPDDESNVISRTGKAYPSDRFEYGDCNQLFDLLEKLHYSTKPKWAFDLRIPKLNYSEKRHFLEDLSTTEMKKQAAKHK